MAVSGQSPLSFREEAQATRNLGLKDFSLSLEMTGWRGFERLLGLLSAKMPPVRPNALFAKPPTLRHRLSDFQVCRRYKENDVEL